MQKALIIVLVLVCGLLFTKLHRAENREHAKARSYVKVNRELAAYKACAFNEWYRGYTWEDDQELFSQCIADWRELH